jgi:hypothetical protein
MQGNYVTLAGFKGNWHFEVYDDYIRMACNDFNGNYNDDPDWTNTNDELMNIRPSSSTRCATYFEFDNNTVENYSGGIINQQAAGRCQNAYAHIHHNQFGPTPSGCGGGNGCEAMWLGLSNLGLDNGRQYGLVENNYFLEWNGDSELFTIKGAANHIRNNCVDISTGMINNRNTDDNIFTGNYIIDANGLGQLRNSGNNSVWAFNFFHDSGGAQGMTTYPQYDQEQYRASTGSEFSYNVFSNTQDYMYQMYDAWPPSTYPIADPKSEPNGMTVSNNDFYTNDTLADYRRLGAANAQTESEFKALNTWSQNNVVGPTLNMAGATCGDSNLFNGPGTEGVTTVTPPATSVDPSPISPPSWWD